MIETTNDFERSTLEQFRERVRDLGEDEMTLIRFLKAREYDMDKAEDMLRKSIIWRKDNDIENVLTWNAPNFLNEELLYEISGHDKQGSPIVVLPIGRWNHRPWVEQGYGEDIRRWGFRIIEDGFQAIKRTKGGRHQAILIFDLENLSYYQAAHMPSLKLIYNAFKGLEQNYPEILKSLVVINAPWVFSIPYNFIKHIMSAHTMSKIRIFDSNKNAWLDFLTEMAPQKALPQEYFEDENGN